MRHDSSSFTNDRRPTSIWLPRITVAVRGEGPEAAGGEPVLLTPQQEPVKTINHEPVDPDASDRHHVTTFARGLA
jgi:hypothetical protein